MFDFDLPWWELIARGAIVYCALLAMMRVSGRRTVGQFKPFDLLVVMLLSESVSNSMTGGDESLLGGLVIAMALISYLWTPYEPTQMAILKRLRQAS